MILIALSKKSHTYWRLVDENKKIHQYQTASLNSFFKAHSFQKVEKNQLPPIDLAKVQTLFFYSAECNSKEKCVYIADFFSDYFKNAAIKIEDEYLALAHSLCGNEEGIVAGLGSGCFSCLYDGSSIIKRVKSTDEEGSGTYLGKKLVEAYLDNTLPNDLVNLFISKFKPSFEEFQDTVNIYSLKEKEFLASLSPFLFRNIHHPFIADLVYRAFDLFFEKNICVYPDYQIKKVHLSGAIAFYYGNILREVANDKGVNINKVVEVPIAGLTLYHLED